MSSSPSSSSPASSAWPCSRTARAANRINHKAENIAKTGQGINTATDSVIQLNRTNETAASILASAQAAGGQAGQVVTLAQSVDGLAKSINGTAGRSTAPAPRSTGRPTAINGSAAKINKTAKTINRTAKAIAGHATSINGSATNINATAEDINTQAAAILDVAKRDQRRRRPDQPNLDATIGHRPGPSRRHRQHPDRGEDGRPLRQVHRPATSPVPACPC